MSDDFTPEERERLKKLLDSDESAPPASAKIASAESIPINYAEPVRWFKNKVILTIIAILATMGLAAIAVFVAIPAYQKVQATQAIEKTVSAEPVVVSNSVITTFMGITEENQLAGANPKQIALSPNGINASEPYIEFSSANASNDSHRVDLYIDFFSQRSRDMISMNQELFTSLIESGTIVLRIHPVVEKDGFSIFAPEALAEVAGTHPELAWNFFINLMKNSDSLLNDTSTDTSKGAIESSDVIAFIAKIAQNSGVPSGAPDGVDADSIKYLSFFSWLYSGSDDAKLKTGYYPPVLYINNQEIDPDDHAFSDPEAMLKLFSSFE